MGQSATDEHISSYLYYPKNDTWKEITQDNFCHYHSMGHYSCAMHDYNQIIIAAININRKICSASFSLKSLTWSKLDEGSISHNAMNAKLLQSRDQEFVTLLWSSYDFNYTLIYQVSISEMNIGPFLKNTVFLHSFYEDVSQISNLCKQFDAIKSYSFLCSLAERCS